MVDHTVSSHGGTVTAANREDGQGAVFTMTLPPAFPDTAAETNNPDEPGKTLMVFRPET